MRLFKDINTFSTISAQLRLAPENPLNFWHYIQTSFSPLSSLNILLFPDFQHAWGVIWGDLVTEEDNTTKERGYEIEEFYFHPPGHSSPCNSRKRIHYLVPSLRNLVNLHTLCRWLNVVYVGLCVWCASFSLTVLVGMKIKGRWG